MKSAVLDELRHSFRPEFLNRIDDIIVFHALNEEHLKQIVEIQLEGCDNGYRAAYHARIDRCRANQSGESPASIRCMERGR